MSSQQWVCKSCGKKGGFKCYGAGFVVCSSCGRLHIVGPDGQLHLTHVVREYRELAPAPVDGFLEFGGEET